MAFNLRFVLVPSPHSVDSHLDRSDGPDEPNEIFSSVGSGSLAADAERRADHDPGMHGAAICEREERS